MQGVLDGSIPACKFVREAVERQVRDLEHGHERGLWFDVEAAQRVLDFYGFLRHSKGEWAGATLDLSPWQQFTDWVFFGWKNSAGLRRFRTRYEEVPRKNGKSTKAAATGLYLLVGDQEPGAEIFSAATKRDQARITHGEAVRMVNASPFLAKRIRVFRDNLHIAGTASKYEPLGADADTADGLNIHGAIVDELHAHKSRALLDVLDTATGARRQPVLYMITTAGYDRNSVCWEQRQYAEKVLAGVIEDDTFFAFICTIDEGDDWADERTWAKANPNLGVSVKLDDLRRKCKKAQEVPGYQNAFRRLHLNEWTEQDNRWLDMAVWDGCSEGVDPEDLVGCECFGGLDLARTTDLAAFELVFPDDEDAFDVLSFFWCPEQGVRVRARKDRAPYDVWAQQGLIRPTPGASIDMERIRADLVELGELYDIQEIAFDRWGAVQIRTQLEDDGFTMVEFGQGMQSMAAPSRELERLLLSKRLRHGGNPVLRWMASNAAAKQDPAGNIKPDKAKSTGRIDGIVALIMALGRAILRKKPKKKKSVYETRGILTL